MSALCDNSGIKRGRIVPGAFNLSYSRVTHYWSHRFRQAMEIYRAEFSADSRLSLSRVRRLLKTGQYRLYVAQDQDTARVMAFALIWVGARPAFVHLDYIGVGREWQGHGIGTALYRWFISQMKTISPRAQLLTLEVEDALISFYRRSETYVLDKVPYLFPGPQGPIPMHLMVYDRRGRRTLGRQAVQGIIRGLYCGLHQRAKDDAQLRSVIAHVPRRVALV